MISVLLVASAAALSCNLYSCAPTTANWDDGGCITYYEGVYFLRTCTSQQYSYCQPIASPGNSSCALQPASSSYNVSWPGEPCIDDLSCVYGTCRNDTCTGYALGANCTSDASCTPGSYCNMTCMPQLTASQSGCTRDEMCSNSQGCNITTSGLGVCTGYLSLPSGAGVWPCNSYRNNLCSTGMCSTLNAESAFCIDVKSTKYPMECSDSDDCRSTVDNTTQAFTYSTCSCAYNALGSSYCGLFPGDAPYIKYIDYLAKWLTSSAVSKCNTARRIAANCQETYWNEADSMALSYYKAYVDNFAAIQQNDRCVQAIYTSTYWELAEDFQEPQDDDDDDDSLWLIASWGILVSFI